jgi:hypothetical protein
MSDQAPRESFNQFFDFLKQVDKDYLSEQRFVTEADDIAEGQHMLLHLVKAGIDVWVDNDASRPRFAPLQSGVLKWGGEGPDNPTFCAPLDNHHRYVVRGKMGKEVYISFTVYTGKEEGDWNDGVMLMVILRFLLSANQPRANCILRPVNPAVSWLAITLKKPPPH